MESDTGSARALRYTLGLDLGIASIGWALVRLDSDGRPTGIEKLGTHIFESGTEGDADSGRDSSRAGPRRLARAQRKSFFRRALRKRKLLKQLQVAGLLPGTPQDIESSEGIDAMIKRLDHELRKKWEADGTTDHRLRQLLPYRLRAAACERGLDPFEVGRAIYHLAQRRGYLSNRREESVQISQDSGNSGKSSDDSQATPSISGGDDDAGVVRGAIVELERRMKVGGFQTLGAFFSSLDPVGLEAGAERIRSRWTAREMFSKEFDTIWAVQSKHHSGMNEKAYRNIKRAIFYQRPLRSMKHLIGNCELVPDAKRAPVASPIAQRFRLLQSVNNLKLRFADHTERRLTAEERKRLIDRLQTEGDVAFSKLKTNEWFGRGVTFNLEEGGEKRLIGNRTESKLRALFGSDRWDNLSASDRDAVIEDLISFEKPSALTRRGRSRWSLNETQADDFGQMLLEQGYAAHSRVALEKLVMRMEEGIEYSTARKEEFPESFVASKAHDLLPPVEESLGNLRNPAISRALTESRKLVNAVIRRYGKPEIIRVELARELKKARKLRERLARENRARESERERVVQDIVRKAGIQRPSRDDIERVMLAEECGWICPYTGKGFSFADVIGRHPQVDVEHIWPLSRSLDNGFGNKTLCWHEENRSRKRNRTPFEAYHGTPQWEEILERVKRFKGDFGRTKLGRFCSKELPEGFAERQLTETRYIATKCAEYVGLLYGGHVDAQGRRRVFTPSGGLTYHLRREWMLDAVLSGKDDTPQAMKNRGDHRHHAIDALVIALTDSRSVERLQRAAEQASSAGRRLFAPMDTPWDNFTESVREAVEVINVSCRQRKRLRGKLHADSLYSKPHGEHGEFRIRKPVDALTPAMLDAVVDPHVKAAIETKLKSLGQTDCRKAFKDRANHPAIVGKDGLERPIHKVRIRVKETARQIGSGVHTRYVGSTDGSNHHVDLYRMSGRGGKSTGELQVTTRLNARGARRSPDTPARSFVASFAIGDFAFVRRNDGVEVLCRVTSTDEKLIEFVEHSDGRRKDVRIQSGDRIRIGGTNAVNGAVRKVAVNYLGEIRRIVG